VARLGAEGPLSIARLTEGTKVSRQAVTKHLRVLAGAGLARSATQGREHLWEFLPEPLDEVRRSLDLISRRWDEALERLRAAVEEDPGEPSR
jgi:DNA-binding transcriptional ArsR family regulator